MKRSLAAVTLASAAVLLTAPTAFAAQNANGSVTVTPSEIGPGGTVHVSGSVSTQSCPTSDSVTVTGESSLFPPDGFGPSAQRDAQGRFSLDYTVPTSTIPARYQIGLRCGGGNVGVAAVLTVTTPSGAPQTGAGGSARRSSEPWTLVGLGCVLAAATAFGARRAFARRGA
jgi:type 1 fimbria pilin